MTVNSVPVVRTTEHSSKKWIVLGSIVLHSAKNCVKRSCMVAGLRDSCATIVSFFLVYPRLSFNTLLIELALGTFSGKQTIFSSSPF